MTEDELRAFLDENKVEIQKEVKARAIARLLEEHRWTIGDAISKAVNKFVEDEIIPEVRNELASQKGVIVEGIVKSIAGISDLLAKALTDAAAKNVSTSYNLDKVSKAIFGY